jgi:hypothetical protein
LRHHRAVEGFPERFDQVFLRLCGDVEPTILLGQAADVEDALLACPREILNAIADDVDGQLLGRRMEFFAKVARRASARLFAVGDHDDDARLIPVVEHLGRLLHRRGQGRAATRRESVHRAHDYGPGIGGGLEIEVDVALLVRPRTIGDEADAAKFRGARQNLSQRVPRFVNPWDGGRDTLSDIPGHRA